MRRFIIAFTVLILLIVFVLLIRFLYYQLLSSPEDLPTPQTKARIVFEGKAVDSHSI